jgi:hypothetical protein
VRHLENIQKRKTYWGFKGVGGLWLWETSISYFRVLCRGVVRCISPPLKVDLAMLLQPSGDLNPNKTLYYFYYYDYYDYHHQSMGYVL